MRAAAGSRLWEVLTGSKSLWVAWIKRDISLSKEYGSVAHLINAGSWTKPDWWHEKWFSIWADITEQECGGCGDDCIFGHTLSQALSPLPQPGILYAKKMISRIGAPGFGRSFNR
ncbi:hypothetical protein QJS10_CPB18g00712 [Acorus calamus]|uniref:Uncharacterized protein n=1 Tax=Acorus calamus TaxID=4465 RepID=A0AAV9CPT3_ACOCL|nr:hypothetical protein QJS10_CPB18g00712 [Acorus calamus]